MKQRYVYIMLLLMFFTIPMDAQCAMCRAVLESEEGQETARGVNNGIVYLMIIPYFLIGIVGYFIYKNNKKTSKTN
ncbi:hypothetical protein [Aquimarina sp. RZ0]|uniref:hypothetical protein n=1 Tax=Aquimarina sp. RZ0 TaxID=2607730 RepID=UPI0011F3C4DD|nr:hypothetical protein [Aquimarina sp. RZ0]KAA1245919.1 hypothetical protein F0000_10190 [Aquimarina sp. RZ0]